MKKYLGFLWGAAVLIVLAAPPAMPGVYAQAPSGTQFQITIASNAHQTYGLYYPVTYMFQIPSGVSGLTAQYRFNTGDAWITLEERTSSDFFNGINAARFDYGNNTAYLSVAFSSNSDDIFLRVLDGQTEVSVTYLGIPLYYDNRHAAVTVSLDDWDWSGNEPFDDACRFLTNAHVHHTVGIITYMWPPDWSLIQYWVDAGYTEPASHTRTHPGSDWEYQIHGYTWEIAGSRDDILANLTLAYPYVPAFIEPHSFTSPPVRQAVVEAGYLVDRAIGGSGYYDFFAPWGSDGTYERWPETYNTYEWPTGSGGSAALRDEANAVFDGAYNNGGIYHLTDHPNQLLWFEGSYMIQHIDYIKERTDVWYAGLGHLYLYHYVQERGQVTVSVVGAPAPSIAVTKSANPTSVPDTGGDVEFTIAVTNDGLEDVTIDSLSDTDFDLAVHCPSAVGTLLASGESYTCIFTESIAGDSGGPDHENTATAVASDDDGNSDTQSATATVTFTDVLPDIGVTKSADPAEAPETGGDVEFTIGVTNDSLEDVTIDSLSDTDFDLATHCPDAVGTLLAFGESYTCIFTESIAGDSGGPDHENTATAVASYDDGNSDTQSATATVTFTDVLPDIGVTKSADPTSVPETGGDVEFTIAVTNDSLEDVTIDSLSDTDFDLATHCPDAVGTLLASGESYTCIFTEPIAGDSGGPDHENTVTAVASDDDGNSDTQSATATVTITDVPSTIWVTKNAAPTYVLEPGGAVTFTVRVDNLSAADSVTIITLTDSIHGDLDGLGTCDVPQDITPGGFYECSFTAIVSGNAGDSETDTVTAQGIDDDGNPLSADGTATVDIADVSSTIWVTKNAAPTYVLEPGGAVTFTVRVDNLSAADSVTIITLTDSIHGDLDGLGTCDVPQDINPGGSYECAFSATVSGNADDSETDIVIAGGTDDDGEPVEGSDDATVTIANVTPTITVTKTADPTVVRTGDAVDFAIRVYNHSVESVTLTGLDDTVFGDLTTECGLPVDIAVGGFFECVISRTISADHSNTITATAEDDEGSQATDSADASVDVIKPAIQVVKEASASTAHVGEVITYTYSVENVGDMTLTDVSASDDRLGAISLGSTTLAPGGITTGTATYPVDESDLPGPLTNTVTVTGTPPLGADVTDSYTVVIRLEPAPAPPENKVYLPIVLDRSAPPAPPENKVYLPIVLARSASPAPLLLRNPALQLPISRCMSPVTLSSYLALAPVSGATATPRGRGSKQKSKRKFPSIQLNKSTLSLLCNNAGSSQTFTFF